jgi:hypothetical protein
LVACIPSIIRSCRRGCRSSASRGR